MTWIGNQDDIDAVNWGWSMQNHQLIPIMSQMIAAPESLLKIIHCNCSSACRHSAVLAEDTDCHALLRADHANFRTVTIRTTDFFQMNWKMEDD